MKQSTCKFSKNNNYANLLITNGFVATKKSLRIVNPSIELRTWCNGKTADIKVKDVLLSSIIYYPPGGQKTDECVCPVTWLKYLHGSVILMGIVLVWDCQMRVI